MLEFSGKPLRSFRLKTLQTPVFWKLPIRRPPAHDILVLHFKCQPLSAWSYVFLYKVRTFRPSL